MNNLKIQKSRLVETVKANKAKHLKEYEKAVKAYNEEAKVQIAEAEDKLEKGCTDISLDLVSPINNSEEYDRILSMLDWETEEYIELTQGQHDEWILDKTYSSSLASLSNQTYFSSTH